MGKRTAGAIPRFRLRRTPAGSVRYYYDHGVDPAGRRVLEPLGHDRHAALKKWAEIEGLREQPREHRITVRDAIAAYRRGELLHKARKTQVQYEALLTRIEAVFGALMLDDLTPAQVRAWYDLTVERRGLVTANRSKAMLSAMFNWSRIVNLTAAPNPCVGVFGRKESGRKSVLVSDELFRRVLDAADEPLRRAMRLADLTGLRPGDLLALERSNIVDGHLVVQTRKTGAPWACAIEGELQVLVDELLAFRGKRVDVAPALLRDENGEPMTRDQLRSRFDRARRKAKVDKAAFRFQDIRARAATRVTLRDGIEAAQRLLAHSSAAMTQRYARASKPVKPA